MIIPNVYAAIINDNYIIKGDSYYDLLNNEKILQVRGDYILIQRKINFAIDDLTFMAEQYQKGDVVLSIKYYKTRNGSTGYAMGHATYTSIMRQLSCIFPS